MSHKILRLGITLLLSLLFFSLIVFLTWHQFGQITQLSFFIDDWPLIHGISQYKTPFFNPLNVPWTYASERFTIREGPLQVWYTSILYLLYGANPTIFHLSGLIVKVIAVLTLSIVSYYLSKKWIIGVLAGIFFSVMYVGSYSMYWFNVYTVYLFIALLLITIVFVIKGLQGNTRFYILSLILTALCIYLYPPRAQPLFLLPFIGLLWVDKINKKILLKSFVLLITAYLSFTVFFGNAGREQTASTLSRMVVLSGPSFEKGDRMFTTYPFISIPFTIFSQDFLTRTANFPSEFRLFENNRLWVTHMRFWIFFGFPIVWITIVYSLFLVSKSSDKKRKKTLKSFFSKKALYQSLMFIKKTPRSVGIWIAMGFVWSVVNFLLKKYFFITNWQWPTHFLFILAGFLFLFSCAGYWYLRKSKNYSIYFKLFLSCLFLIVGGFIISWAFDPIIYPNSLNGFSRYLTVPSVFGALFAATGLAFLYSLTNEFNRIAGNLKYIVKTFVLIIIVLISYRYVVGNIKITASELKPQYVDVFGQENTNLILSTIESKVEFNDPPDVVLIEAWDYAVGFNMIMMGYSFAVRNDITDINKTPILFFDEKTLISSFDDICKTRNVNPLNVHRFKIEKGKITDMSSTLPPLSCETSNEKVREETP